MFSGTLKLAIPVLAAALLLATLVSGQGQAGVGSFLRALLSPPASQVRVVPRAVEPDPDAGDEVVLKPDALGHFHANVEIGGQTIPMMVDTGASIVLLSANQAASIGIRPFSSDFRLKVQTANGVVEMAQVTLPEVQVGAVIERDVAAAVARSAFHGEGLLGMSFLRRLRGYEVNDGLLILKN